MNIRQQKAIQELVANGGSVAGAMRKAGYSKNTARTPKKLTTSKSYVEVMEPVIDRMMKERERLIDALSRKKLSKEKYRDMIDGLDKLTKNIQLLNGGATERAGFSITFDNAFTPAPKKDSK